MQCDIQNSHKFRNFLPIPVRIRFKSLYREILIAEGMTKVIRSDCVRITYAYYSYLSLVGNTVRFADGAERICASLMNEDRLFKCLKFFHWL